MWGVIAAWLVCLASLSLPWPGIIIVALLCCLALFELASPAAWLRRRKNDRNIIDGTQGNWKAGLMVRWPTTAMVKQAFSWIRGVLEVWRDGEKRKELDTVGGKSTASAPPALERRMSGRQAAQPVSGTLFAELTRRVPTGRACLLFLCVRGGVQTAVVSAYALCASMNVRDTGAGAG